jgi:hypothetical protein
MCVSFDIISTKFQQLYGPHQSKGPLLLVVHVALEKLEVVFVGDGWAENHLANTAERWWEGHGDDNDNDDDDDDE